VECADYEIVFTFDGADAGAGFFCEFHIATQGLQRVHIAWGEFPEVWEDRILDESATRIARIQKSRE
jgi:hypothetical protein